MNKIFLAFIASAAMCTGALVGMTTNAATVEELEAKARAYGFPESAIAQGLNEYYKDPSSYDLDEAMDMLDVYHAEILKRLGIDPEIKPSPTDPPNQNETVAEETTSSQTATDAQTPTKPSLDGAVGSNKVKPDNFGDMTLDEKQQFVASLTDEERAQLANELTASELKEIVKELPADDKAAVVDKFVQAGGALGVNVSVTNISGDNISVDLRDKNGDLIDKASFGIIVEDTGLDHRPILLIAASCMLTAIAGIWFVFKKTGSDKRSR